MVKIFTTVAKPVKNL